MRTMKQRHCWVKIPKKSNHLFNRRGTYAVRDLTDVLVEPNINPQNFVYTQFLTSVIAIVPITAQADFERDYAMLTDYVVPGSAVKLNVPDKDNLSIW